jgi:hypothetical protein
MEGNLEGNFAGKNSGKKEKRKFRVMEKEIIFLGVETLVPMRIPIPKIYKLCFFERVYGLVVVNILLFFMDSFHTGFSQWQFEKGIRFFDKLFIYFFFPILMNIYY